MKKHISEVELCQRTGYIHYDSCERYHKDDFCLLCGYEMEGDRLYLEIHGDNGAINRVKDIDSSQPYVCMEGADNLAVIRCDMVGIIREVRMLKNFIKEGKK